MRPTNITDPVADYAPRGIDHPAETPAFHRSGPGEAAPAAPSLLGRSAVGRLALLSLAFGSLWAGVVWALH